MVMPVLDGGGVEVSVDCLKTDDGVIALPSGMDKMGEISGKLRSTLTGIQSCEIEAPEGWICRIL